LSYFPHINSYGWSISPWSDRTGFSDCTKLTSVDVVNFNISTSTDDAFSKAAFRGCSNLVTVKNFKNIAVPQFMFAGCEKLQNIDLSNVTKIGDNAFEDCISLDLR